MKLDVIDTWIQIPCFFQESYTTVERMSYHLNMKAHSIQLRHDLYFKLLALLNLLWNENFQEEVILSSENKRHLDHIEEIMGSLLRLGSAQKPPEQPR